MMTTVFYDFNCQYYTQYSALCKPLTVAITVICTMASALNNNIVNSIVFNGGGNTCYYYSFVVRGNFRIVYIITMTR